MSKNNVLSLSLEGNIGAGKSTFLKLINQWLDVNVVYEPHEKWQHVGGENLLDKFYKDTSRWAYTFQTYAFVTRVLEQEASLRNSDSLAHVFERSIYSDRYCFAKNCFDMGTMNALEWKLYQEWFSWLSEAYTQKIGGFIYLQTDPEVCYKRLLKRNRFEEATVSLDYLKMIDEKHEAWLIHKKIESGISELPVLVLECNKDFEGCIIEQEKHMQKISEFFGIPLRTNFIKENNPSISL